jgi:hypothetical protein
MTYADAVDWAIDNVPMDFYDSYSEWFDAVKSELQTPELISSNTFNEQMQKAWENEVGSIKKTRKQLEEEQEAQRRIDEIEEFEEPEIVEPEIQEPTAQDVEHELERNLPEDIRSRGFIKQEQAGALSNVLSSLPKGTKISIPQAKGAPIDIKPSVTFPKGITMVRPATTPAVVGATVRTTFRQSISTVAKSISGGAKRALSAVRGLFRI